MHKWTLPPLLGMSEHSEDKGLFSELGLEQTKVQTAGYWALRRDDQAGAALRLIRPDGIDLYVDFVHGKARHRARESGFGAHALIKALGVKHFVRQHSDYPKIIDATGGLGQDAWALASAGCRLTIFERHPLIHALLADGLARAAADPATRDIAARLMLIRADAEQGIGRPGSQTAHAIYLDPMYPPRRRKAASKKGMQFLHELLGPASAEQSPSLLLSTIVSGVSRVVVKRPKGATCLPGTEQHKGQLSEVQSPNTRYDIYHCNIG